MILQNAEVGRLHVEGMDVPEAVEPSDEIVIDPTYNRRVASSLRKCNQ